MRNKKISSLLCLLAVCFGFVSCAKESLTNEDEIKDNTGKGKVYRVSLAFEGEFLEQTQMPLVQRKNEGKKTYYGINVYRVKSGKSEKYAYGVFDNVQNLTIELSDKYKYQFDCTVLRDKTDTLYYKKGADGTEVMRPFDRISSNVTPVSNKFIISDKDNLKGLAMGMADLNENEYKSYPRMDRYYGISDEFTPNADGNVSIDMKRCVCGIHFIVTPPKDGVLKISCPVKDFTVASTDNAYDDEDIYVFNKLDKCLANPNFGGYIKLTIVWTRGDGTEETFEKELNIKCCVMTTVNIKSSSLSSEFDSRIVLNMESTEMKKDTVDVVIEGR